MSQKQIFILLDKIMQDFLELLEEDDPDEANLFKEAIGRAEQDEWNKHWSFGPVFEMYVNEEPKFCPKGTTGTFRWKMNTAKKKTVGE